MLFRSLTLLLSLLLFLLLLADFPCPLLYLPTSSSCPSLTYAAALPQTPTGLLTSLPSNLSSSLDSYLASFATTLSTYACGRDNYSPVSSCEMCYEVYREWLCRTMIPRVSLERDFVSVVSFFRSSFLPSSFRLTLTPSSHLHLVRLLLLLQSQSINPSHLSLPPLPFLPPRYHPTSSPPSLHLHPTPPLS